MKVRNASASVTLALMALTLPPARVSAQGTNMTPDQARQALLPYVQAPDTTLGASPVVDNMGLVSFQLTNDTDYMFYGDSNGGFGARYWMDAVNGDKDIDYGETTTWDHDPADAPTMLSSVQLTQIATNYVAAHFPGYSVSTLLGNNGGNPPSAQDPFYSVVFGAQSASGAALPILCRVELEEDIGHVSGYEEEYIPVTISTTPALTQAQAISDGQQWIAANYSTDPNDSTVRSAADSEDGVPVQLMVDVDQSNNQTLVYKIEYYGVILYVDGQTGATDQIDYWDSMPEKLLARTKHLSAAQLARERKRLARRLEKREQFWDMSLSDSGGSSTNRMPIRIHGQTYLWAGYLKLLGVDVRRQRGKLLLTKGQQTIILGIRGKAAGVDKYAWERKNELYVPLASVQKLSPQVTVDENKQLVMLNLKAPLSAESLRAPQASHVNNSTPPGLSLLKSP